MPDLFDFAAAAHRPDPYPASPGYKDRDTSRLAARVAAGRVELLRDQCLLALRKAGQDGIGGLTADEAALQIGENVLSIRPRFSELVRLGKIKDSGQRRRNESGATAKVWVCS